MRDGLLHAHTRLHAMHRASLHSQARLAAQEYVRWAWLLVDWGATRRSVDATQPLPSDFGQRICRLPATKAMGTADLGRVAGLLEVLQDLGRPREGTPSPDAMDAHLLAHGTAWLTAELVRLLGAAEPQAAAEVAERLLRVPRPLAWEREGLQALRTPGLKVLDRVLVVLYFHPHLSLEEARKLLPEDADIAVTGAATQNPDLVFYSKRAGTLEITPAGREHVEREVLTRKARQPEKPERGPRQPGHGAGPGGPAGGGGGGKRRRRRRRRGDRGPQEGDAKPAHPTANESAGAAQEPAAQGAEDGSEQP